MASDDEGSNGSPARRVRQRVFEPPKLSRRASVRPGDARKPEKLEEIQDRLDELRKQPPLAPCLEDVRLELTLVRRTRPAEALR